MGLQWKLSAIQIWRTKHIVTATSPNDSKDKVEKMCPLLERDKEIICSEKLEVREMRDPSLHPNLREQLSAVREY